ncbi:MAG TPA: SHOCT domain-containing protein [Acidimicrobiales bacterium]|nr:SHOCT domain-containing protein [Acidimicrobiales bacterium]
MFRYPMPYAGPRQGGFPVLGVLILIALALLLALGVVALIRYWRTGAVVSGHPAPRPWFGPPAGPPPFDPALHELRMRYARGELSREEFLQRLVDLGGPAAPPGAPPPPPPGP